MSVDLHQALAPIAAEALKAPVETTLGELLTLCGSDVGDPFETAERVDAYFQQLGLEFSPKLNIGEIETSRVLRDASMNPLDIVQGVAALGESSRTEFKASLYTSMRDWTQSDTLVEHKSLAGEALKTVCAFLNTEGGHLLIGMGDDGQPSGGIELDLKVKGWDLDKWQLSWTALVRGRFHESSAVMPFVRSVVETVGGKAVMVVEVASRGAPSFVKRDSAYEFFVRNGPRTDSLDLPAFYAHVSAVRTWMPDTAGRDMQ